MGAELIKGYFRMSSSQKFDARAMMERAIAVMRKSVKEPRDDNKASPLVGAVLCKPDGRIETACRGELRHGDHAEFTLLERKHRNERLDGSVLFATLEPCAPGARKHPKLSCAERIVLARIKEVWVGIEDPDPTVDRKGIKYLQDNGVTVNLFDRDLQEKIRRLNKEFISQARERAEKKGKEKPVVFSKLEALQPGVKLDDFSDEAVKLYREKAQITEPAGSATFNRRLILQGVLTQSGNKIVPTGLGIMLFGRNPRDVIQQAGLKGTIEYPDGTNEIHDFDGPMILIPSAIEKWLRDKLPNVIERNQMTRGEKVTVPFEVIRESVINALVHRDYDVEGAICHLVVTANTITVKSPGAPLLPVTVEQLQAFNAPMLNRNPKLQYVFSGTKLVEGRGLGMKTLGAVAEKYHLPLPKFSFDGVYLTLTIYRNAQGAVQALTSKVLDALNKDEKNGLQLLSTKRAMTRKEYADQMSFDDRKAQRHFKHFVELGLLKQVGSGPSTAYQVVRK